MRLFGDFENGILGYPFSNEATILGKISSISKKISEIYLPEETVSVIGGGAFFSFANPEMKKIHLIDINKMQVANYFVSNQIIIGSEDLGDLIQRETGGMVVCKDHSLGFLEIPDKKQEVLSKLKLKN